MRGVMHLAMAVLLGACVGTTSAGPDGERTPPTATPVVTLAPGVSVAPIRTFALASPNAGGDRVCPAFAVEDPVSGTLTGAWSGPEHVWLVGPSGRISVVWPEGFTLVFAPDAILYDEAGRVFARAGDTITLGQIRVTAHAGTLADPYLAAGLIGSTGPSGSSAVDCVPAADGTPYASP